MAPPKFSKNLNRFHMLSCSTGSFLSRSVFLFTLLLTLVHSKHLRKEPTPQENPSGSNMLASKRPILESNPSHGNPRFPKHFSTISDPENDQPSVPPPVPFSQMNPADGALGISAVDTGQSFPIGTPYVEGAGYPLTAKPPGGIPNLMGVSEKDDENAGDNSPPNWQQ